MSMTEAVRNVVVFFIAVAGSVITNVKCVCLVLETGCRGASFLVSPFEDERKVMGAR
jgi:hypothetical protein